MKVTDLVTNQLVQLGRDTLLKISTPDPEHETTTATVVLEGGQPPNRTTVRTYDALAVASMTTPSGRLMDAYLDAYRLPWPE